MAGRFEGLYAGTFAPDVHAKLPDADPAGRGGERRQQLARPQAELLRDDRDIRLDVDRDYTTAYELSFDSRGWTHDACWNDSTWNPKWFVAAKTDEAAWTIEAAIPLAELVAEPPTAKQVWAASIVRTIPRAGEETWSGEANSADSPQKFGLLIFE